ncbi:hypothetical protein [Neorhizobium sp. P12A]|uniref:hypothetical protein n=1 Tax=Neorhizobium sp. P12A TaxID=2268027 RepID=UPI0011F033EB|nr:hypothetical protein [Neorhizobium sp. P12A]
MKKLSRMKAVNEEFLSRVLPQFGNWGLSRHPNPRSYFGRDDAGFRYDFADLNNRDDVKIACFSLIQPNASLWIKGYRVKQFVGEATDLVIASDHIKDIFTLTRKWSILRPMYARLELARKSDLDPREQARSLIDDVEAALPKLMNYLYK